VKAYIFGHTHNYSVVKINRLWHVDVGHARGTADRGAKSTYMIVNVDKNNISYQSYRLNGKNEYELADQGDFN
jgi:predicted phosphodiesterase